MSEQKHLSPLIRQLSSYIAGALKRRLPRQVAERAKLHLLDTLAAMVSGSRQLPGKHAIAFIKPLGGAQQAGARHWRRHQAKFDSVRDVRALRRSYAAQLDDTVRAGYKSPRNSSPRPASRRGCPCSIE